MRRRASILVLLLLGAHLNLTALVPAAAGQGPPPWWVGGGLLWPFFLDTATLLPAGGIRGPGSRPSSGSRRRCVLFWPPAPCSAGSCRGPGSGVSWSQGRYCRSCSRCSGSPSGPSFPSRSTSLFLWAVFGPVHQSAARAPSRDMSERRRGGVGVRGAHRMTAASVAAAAAGRLPGVRVGLRPGQETDLPARPRVQLGHLVTLWRRRVHLGGIWPARARDPRERRRLRSRRAHRAGAAGRRVPLDRAVTFRLPALDLQRGRHVRRPGARLRPAARPPRREEGRRRGPVARRPIRPALRGPASRARHVARARLVRGRVPGRSPLKRRRTAGARRWRLCSGTTRCTGPSPGCSGGR